MVLLFTFLISLPIFAGLSLITSFLGGAVLMWLENLCGFWTDFGYWHNVWVFFAGSLLVGLLGLHTKTSSKG